MPKNAPRENLEACMGLVGENLEGAEKSEALDGEIPKRVWRISKILLGVVWYISENAWR